MARNIYRNVAYGLSDSLLDVFQPPIVSTRDPNTNDKYQLGTLWVNRSTDDAFILCSVIANGANWISVGGGSGIFSSLTVNPGNVLITAGDLTVAQGDITVTAGDLDVIAGSITAGNGLTVSTGNAVVSSGDLVLTAGNISVTLG